MSAILKQPGSPGVNMAELMTWKWLQWLIESLVDCPWLQSCLMALWACFGDSGTPLWKSFRSPTCNTSEVRHQLSSEDVQWVAWRGRWARNRTLEFYLQEVSAQLLVHELPPAARQILFVYDKSCWSVLCSVLFLQSSTERAEWRFWCQKLFTLKVTCAVTKWNLAVDWLLWKIQQSSRELHRTEKLWWTQTKEREIYIYIYSLYI